MNNTNTMNETTQWAGTGNVLCTTLSFILLFISQLSLSDFAAIAAIIAALTTAGLNVYKFIKLKNKKNE